MRGAEERAGSTHSGLVYVWNWSEFGIPLSDSESTAKVKVVCESCVSRVCVCVCVSGK